MAVVPRNVCLGLLMLLPPYAWAQAPASTVQRLAGWEFRVQKLPPPASAEVTPWRPVGELRRRDLLPGDGLLLRVRLPQAYPDGAQLLLPASASAFTVYLENEPIYRYGQTHGFTWHLVPFPPAMAANGFSFGSRAPCWDRSRSRILS